MSCDGAGTNADDGGRRRVTGRRSWRLAGMAGVALTLAVSPALAQGKSQQAHGKNGRGSSPNQTALPAGGAAQTGAAPFAWIDDANVMEPGQVAIGLSMVRWQGSGLSEMSAPIIDAAMGLAPRFQLAASVPRVMGSGDPARPAGGIGTTYVSGKIALLPDRHGVKLAVSPTLEILSMAAMESVPVGQNRSQWGLPVSVEADRPVGRVYGSVGYFSPGIWFMGAGAGRQLGARLSGSISLSRAWTNAASPDPAVAGPRRNELSGGAFYQITQAVGLSGSIGHTIATTAEDGAGMILGIGVSVTARSNGVIP